MKVSISGLLVMSVATYRFLLLWLGLVQLMGGLLEGVEARQPAEKHMFGLDKIPAVVWQEEVSTTALPIKY